MNQVRSTGTSLPQQVREFMEPRFGRSLADVRVHDDSRAANLSREIGAEAFTSGRDVFFRQGAFRPTTAAGRSLIAHELAHVLQQSADGSSSIVQRQAAPDAKERESKADAQASRLIEQFTVPGLVFDDLDEPQLAARLAQLAHEPAEIILVRRVFDRLDSGDREQVAAAFVQASSRAALRSLAQDAQGLALLLDLLSAATDDDATSRLILRALFPAPPPLSPSDFPVLAIRGGRVEVTAYERGGVFRSLDGTIIGERGLESTLSPVDFIVPGAGAARALLNLGRAAVSAGVRGALTSAVSRGVLRLTPQQIATAGVAAEGAFTTGVIGGGVNAAVQVATLDDLRKFDWGAVAVDFVLGALLSAYVGQVVARLPIKTTKLRELFTAENLAKLAKQQGLIAPVTFAANSIRAAIFNVEQEKALAASALETALGAAQSGIVQILLRGPVGDLIFKGSKVAVDDRIRSGQAAILKKALSFIRATIPRLIFGVVPQGEQEAPATGQAPGNR